MTEKVSQELQYFTEIDLLAWYWSSEIQIIYENLIIKLFIAWSFIN